MEYQTQYVEIPDHAIDVAWKRSQPMLVRKHGKPLEPIMAEQLRLVKLLLSGDPTGRVQQDGL